MAKSTGKELSELFDRMGNRIVPGSIIVYANALGRCSKTAIGKVLRIVETKDEWRGARTSLRVVSIQDETYNLDAATAKEVTLSEIERVLLYPEKYVAPVLLKLLNQGELKGPCKTCGHGSTSHCGKGACYKNMGPDEEHYKSCGCKKYNPELPKA